LEIGASKEKWKSLIGLPMVLSIDAKAKKYANNYSPGNKTIYTPFSFKYNTVIYFRHIF